ncbi:MULTISPECIES: hypothetical protein [unclassified Synechococcus]|nr:MULTISPECIES: hypothetical protein [unclassified Synechococcus]
MTVPTVSPLLLPPSERLALAIALWDSPEAAVPWDEVRSQLGIG